MMPSARSLMPAFVAGTTFRHGLCILAALALGAMLFESVGMPVFQRIGLPRETCCLRDTKLVWKAGKSVSSTGSASPSASSSSPAPSPTSWRCRRSGATRIHFIAT